MAAGFEHLQSIDPESQLVNVVIDTPKGSRNKYKWNEAGHWQLSKVLPQGMCFPYDFGFIPQTRGEDGDPVDVLLIMDEPAFPGCVVSARLIGVIEAEQTERRKTVRNDRLIAVVETPFNPAEYESLDQLHDQRIEELEHFFIAYNEVEGRKFKPLRRRGNQRARQLLDEAMTKKT
ncbi:MAG TPA: inorganic diphosphatase [Pirellulales bacterium]|jgi:inorganic pyrophosphatase|nr:inorganic diphosphatase [Pirellulales bacterium]